MDFFLSIILGMNGLYRFWGIILGIVIPLFFTLIITGVEKSMNFSSDKFRPYLFRIFWLFSCLITIFLFLYSKSSEYVNDRLADNIIIVNVIVILILIAYLWRYYYLYKKGYYKKKEEEENQRIARNYEFSLHQSTNNDSSSDSDDNDREFISQGILMVTNGFVLSANYEEIGRIANSYVYDSLSNCIGRIENGYVYDSQSGQNCVGRIFNSDILKGESGYNFIGHVLNGTLYDSNSKCIAVINGGNEEEIGAAIMLLLL